MVEQSRYSLILASASRRRRQLLAEAGYKFKVCPADIDESVFLSEGISPCQYARRLALAKAKSVAARFSDCLIVGADTVVDFDGRIIGKPADAKQAERITRGIFSAPHRVITAVAIVRLSDNTEIVETDSTVVYPKKVTDEQIAEHIKSGCWQDKAGAYAIKQDGDEFIEKIDGSLTNVMGLPMELLQWLLKRFPD